MSFAKALFLDVSQIWRISAAAWGNAAAWEAGALKEEGYVLSAGKVLAI
jgi:hypothetical protein